MAERLPLVRTDLSSGPVRPGTAWEPDCLLTSAGTLHRIDVDTTAVTATDAMVTAMHTPQLDPERPLWDCG
ncbi:hypothetical protein [Streptomyces sp. KL116D]|uniref:hypothetical protein n=1 Tax=Streptomyces sp. KL116D TaxID=3045152 RepID=UPI003555F10B